MAFGMGPPSLRSSDADRAAGRRHHDGVALAFREHGRGFLEAGLGLPAAAGFDDEQQALPRPGPAARSGRNGGRGPSARRRSRMRLRMPRQPESDSACADPAACVRTAAERRATTNAPAPSCSCPRPEGYRLEEPDGPAPARDDRVEGLDERRPSSSTASARRPCRSMRGPAPAVACVLIAWVENIAPVHRRPRRAGGVPADDPRDGLSPGPERGDHAVRGLPGVDHSLSLAEAVTAGVAGNIVGSWIAWAAGGPRAGLLESHGRWLHVTPKRLDIADRWFHRNGAGGCCCRDASRSSAR